MSVIQLFVLSNIVRSNVGHQMDQWVTHRKVELQAAVCCTHRLRGLLLGCLSDCLIPPPSCRGGSRNLRARLVTSQQPEHY
jgi:hypothetical protein